MNELYEKINYLSIYFTSILSVNLIDPLLKIFVGFLSCSLIYTITHDLIIKGVMKFDYIIYKLLNIILIIYIIKHPNILNEYVIGSLHNFLFVILKGLGLIQIEDIDTSSANSILPILSIIQAPIANIIDLAGIVMQSINPLKILSSSIIILIYSYLSTLLIGSVIEFTFSSFIVTSLSPLFSFFMAYKITKYYTYTAIKYLFMKMINIILAVVNIKFILFVIVEIIPELESQDRLDIYQLARWYRDYLMLISIGMFGIKLHKQGKDFVGYIFQKREQNNT